MFIRSLPNQDRSRANRSGDPKVCFAGDGAPAVTIYDVYTVDSGNNSGKFTYLTQSGAGYTSTTPSWYSWTFSPRVQLTGINITGH
ncbi:beta/gamma crystallin domain-containing protein [Kitasatospora sp. NPDC088351]|uniref:beta/gamma crystallin domain-containing protein n=1 Tax=Kitasatospora sp. NPDC088351 TaxID=3155180 RepID=UPI003423B782